MDGLRAAEAEGRVLASLSRNDGDADPFPAIAARCYVAGYDLSAARLFDGAARPAGPAALSVGSPALLVREDGRGSRARNPPFDHPLLGFRRTGPLPYWLNHLDPQVLPWIGDHAVEGVAVFPAAAIIETALAAARWRWPDAPVLEVFDVEMRRPLPFEKGRMRELRTALVSDDGDWELASRPRLSNEPMTMHAVGRIAATGDGLARPHWAESTPIDRIDGESLYRLARDAGLDYGSRFRTVDHVEVFGSDRAVVELELDDDRRTSRRLSAAPGVARRRVAGIAGAAGRSPGGGSRGKFSALALRKSAARGAVWAPLPHRPAAADADRRQVRVSGFEPL